MRAAAAVLSALIATGSLAGAICCDEGLGKNNATASGDSDVLQEAATDRAAVVARLKPLGVLVGDWRGVGQPRRGSRVGAWIEKAHCEWRFGDDDSALVFHSDSDKQFEFVSFGYDRDNQQLTAAIQESGSDERQDYVRDADSSRDSVDVFNDAREPEDVRNRITLRRLSDIRITMLFEQKRSASGSWRRVAEIGYTRAGERLAAEGAGAPQCIVTGGLGTRTVTHEGKTWHVCCDGCRQAFEADPEGTIAAYRERIREQKAP